MNNSPPAAAMTSAQLLRGFIEERLAAAAGEIFSVFQRTVVRYEEELDRQRKLLETRWTPHLGSPGTDVPDRLVDSEDLLFSPEWSCRPEQEALPLPPPRINEQGLRSLQIKEELEERDAGQEVERLLLEPAADVFVPTPAGEQRDPGGRDGPRRPARRRAVPLSPAPRPASDPELGGTRHGDATGNFPTSERRSDRGAGESRLPRRDFHWGETPPPSGATGRSDSLVGEPPLALRGERPADPSPPKKRARVHAGDKPHRCRACGKSFGVQRLLLRHLRAHAGERPYTCQVCGKGCSLRSNLQVHMRTHTGEKPYACHTCGARFGQHSHLLRHLKIHTGERPHTCQVCLKSFSRRGHLLRHALTHTGEKPHACDACGKRFSRQCHLLAHRKVHTGEAT